MLQICFPSVSIDLFSFMIYIESNIMIMNGGFYVFIFVPIFFESVPALVQSFQDSLCLCHFNISGLLIFIVSAVLCNRHDMTRRSERSLSVCFHRRRKRPSLLPVRFWFRYFNVHLLIYNILIFFHE